MIYWKFKYSRTQRALAVGVSEESIKKTDSFAVGYDMGESSEEEYYDDDEDDYIEEDKISCKNKIGFIG